MVGALKRNTWYNFFQQIKKWEWIEYLVLLVFVMFLVTRIIRPTAIQLIALFFAIVIIYYRMDKRRTIVSDAYDELEYRLKSLHPKPENFHMDADIINIFYNMRDFRKYHSEGYDESLVAIDNMLKLVSEVEAGVYHCKENLDVIKDQMNKALNQFHSILFKLPTQLYIMRKHKRALNALHVLLRRHVDDVVRRCKKYYKDREVDIDWHEIRNSGPRPDDTQRQEGSSFDFYY
jgi:hypothetical protein